MWLTWLDPPGAVGGAATFLTGGALAGVGTGAVGPCFSMKIVILEQVNFVSPWITTTLPE
jgi:hypothetical protein